MLCPRLVLSFLVCLDCAGRDDENSHLRSALESMSSSKAQSLPRCFLQRCEL